MAGWTTAIEHRTVDRARRTVLFALVVRLLVSFWRRPQTVSFRRGAATRLAVWA